MQNNPGSDAQIFPLCVDLDGTLVNTDTFIESLIGNLNNLAVLIRIPGWLLQGKAKVKAKLAGQTKLNPALLPFNKNLLNYLSQQKASGRRLVLVTAANERIAEAISRHLGLFDEVISSNESTNLRGKEKAKLLVERFGNRRFSYVGNDRTDLHTWAHAYTAILVNAPDSVAKRAANFTTIEERFTDRPNKTKALLRMLRPYQWVKNILVFVPIITSAALSNLNAWFSALMMFIAFCSTASAIYVINDLYDLDADRQHPSKRKRPLASGALPIAIGFVMIPILLIVGLTFAIATRVPVVVPLLICYAACSIAYSIKLKTMPLVDIFTLALLYSIRLISGGEATGYHVSPWLMAFAGFLFLNLAIIKRVAELKIVIKSGDQQICRRSYRTEDLLVIQTFGIASGFISSLVLALYIQSYTAVSLYANPQALWLIVPIILFWQCRLWLSTSRGHMHDDPIVYAAKDWVTWLVGIFTILILLAANIKVQ